MAEIVNVDAFEDAGDGDPPARPATESSSRAWDGGAQRLGRRKSTTRATRGPSPSTTVKSLLRVQS